MFAFGSLISAIALTCVTTTFAQAQASPLPAESRSTIGGVVTDAGGLPVPDVEVGVIRGENLQQFALTSADGKFSIAGVGPGTIPLRFRRLGYQAQFMDVDTRSPFANALTIILKEVAGELEDVMIAANDQSRLREFYEHKAQRGSFAKFLDQQEIKRRGVMHTSELFRSMPGITIKGSSTGGNTIRIRGCQPMVWIDGQRVPNAELDEVASPGDIAGIEFYTSTAGTPAQYMERTNRACGTVLVWTRNR